MITTKAVDILTDSILFEGSALSEIYLSEIFRGNVRRYFYTVVVLRMKRMTIPEKSRQSSVFTGFLLISRRGDYELGRIL